MVETMMLPPKPVSLPVSGNLEQNVSGSRCEQVPRGAFTFKLVLVGEPGVGKTSLMYRFAEGRVPAAYRPTLGVNILIKTTHIRQETSIKWIIWDVGNQHRIEHLRKAFYMGAAAILIVFDITNPISFEALETSWLKEISDSKLGLATIPVIVVANKVDLEAETATLTDVVQGFRNHNKVHVIETSAHTGKNVEALFEYLSFQCLPSCLESWNF